MVTIATVRMVQQVCSLLEPDWLVAGWNYSILHKERGAVAHFDPIALGVSAHDLHYLLVRCQCQSLRRREFGTLGGDPFRVLPPDVWYQLVASAVSYEWRVLSGSGGFVPYANAPRPQRVATGEQVWFQPPELKTPGESAVAVVQCRVSHAIGSTPGPEPERHPDLELTFTIELQRVDQGPRPSMYTYVTSSGTGDSRETPCSTNAEQAKLNNPKLLYTPIDEKPLEAKVQWVPPHSISYRVTSAGPPKATVVRQPSIDLCKPGITYTSRRINSTANLIRIAGTQSLSVVDCTTLSIDVQSAATLVLECLGGGVCAPGGKRKQEIADKLRITWTATKGEFPCGKDGSQIVWRIDRPDLVAGERVGFNVTVRSELFGSIAQVVLSATSYVELRPDWQGVLAGYVGFVDERIVAEQICDFKERLPCTEWRDGQREGSQYCKRRAPPLAYVKTGWLLGISPKPPGLVPSWFYSYDPDSPNGRQPWKWERRGLGGDFREFMHPWHYSCIGLAASANPAPPDRMAFGRLIDADVREFRHRGAVQVAILWRRSRCVRVEIEHVTCEIGFTPIRAFLPTLEGIDFLTQEVLGFHLVRSNALARHTFRKLFGLDIKTDYERAMRDYSFGDTPRVAWRGEGTSMVEITMQDQFLAGAAGNMAHRLLTNRNLPVVPLVFRVVIHEESRQADVTGESRIQFPSMMCFKGEYKPAARPFSRTPVRVAAETPLRKCSETREKLTYAELFATGTKCVFTGKDGL